VDFSCTRVSLTDLPQVLREADSILVQLPYPVHQLSEWYLTYIDVLGLADVAYVLQVRNQRDLLVGMLALEVRFKRGTRFWNLREFVPLSRGPQDFFGVIAVPGYEVEVAKAIARWLVDNCLIWEQLRLDYIPECSKAWLPLVEALERYGFGVQVTKDRYFLKIDTTQDWNAYYREFLHPRTADLRNRKNRLVKHGFSASVVDIKQGIAHYLDELFAHYDARRTKLGQKYATASPIMKQFVREVVAKYEDRGNVILSLLVEEKLQDVLAYQLDWVFQGIRYHWKPTFNEKYSEYSPSKILLLETIRQCFQDPSIREFNFMRGESQYKNQFANHQEPFVSISVTNHRSVRLKGQNIAKLLAGLRSTLK